MADLYRSEPGQDSLTVHKPEPKSERFPADQAHPFFCFGLVLFAGGLIGSGWGTITYSSFSIRPEIVLHTDERGIIAFAAEAHENRTFHMILDQIDVDSRSARAQPYFEGGMPQPFGFQSPYNVSLASLYGWEPISDRDSTYVHCLESPPINGLFLTWIGVVQ
jgi:hypothetical protein